ncbi:MAG TPA: glycosyltransferase [Candidatus Omnitrophota bacterium]|nr:glycosyltransferase [Candidatus Omnitrophota bacterium]
MSNPRISVIIPCFNARRWICEAIASVFAQKFDGLEIILIDDGSTDGSAEVVRKAFNDVRIITTENRGPSIARNYGTEQSRGEYIQYLDADDMLAGGKLCEQYNILQATHADVAYGRWHIMSRDWRGAYVRKNIAGKPLQDPEIDLFTDAWFPPAAYLFRRSIVEKVGGWRFDLPVIQDARFALDCALYGGRFIYCDGLAACYRKHERGSVSTRNRQAFIRDCFCNAVSVEEWWRQHGGIIAKRKKALVQVYEYVARESIGFDLTLHKKSVSMIRQLDPAYRPTRCLRFCLCQRLCGYEKAELIGYWYRSFRNALCGEKR